MLNDFQIDSEAEVSAPLPRSLGSSPAAAVPYLTIQVGAREFDQNNYWKRHIVRDPTGVVHMAYCIRKGMPGSNNTYRYNVYNAPGFPGALKYADGSEPASGAESMQNGGLQVQPGSNAAIMYGRAPVITPANSGCVTSLDSGQALGLFTLDTMVANGATGNSSFTPLDPVIRAIDSATWVAGLADFSATGSGVTATIPDCFVTRTTDAGETWSTPVYRTYGGFANTTAITSNPSGSLIYIVSPADPADTGAFFTTERPCYIKSTDRGQTWTPITDITGDFELPEYAPVAISIEAQMVGDTLHVFWLDWDRGSGLHPGGPGGHMHHVAVFPDGSIDGPQKVADVKLDGRERGRSDTGLGAGFGVWVHVSSSYRLNPTPLLFCLWSQPPDNGSGGFADSTDPAAAGGRSFGNFDIFLSSSRDHGRTWNAPQNVTATQNPGCNGTTRPCASEDMFTAAEETDSLIYVLAKVDLFPGYQSFGDPGPDTRLSDEHRLYLIPAVHLSKGDLDGDGLFTINDAVLLLNCVFDGSGICDNAYADINCDADKTPSDVILELNAVFLSTPFPCP